MEVELAGVLKAVVFRVSVLGYSDWPYVGGGPKFPIWNSVSFLLSGENILSGLKMSEKLPERELLVEFGFNMLFLGDGWFLCGALNCKL